jgi:hypothetical protein
MSSSGTVSLKLVWAMLDECAKGYTTRQGQHNWIVMHNGKTFRGLTLGKHGKRTNPEVQIGHVRQLVRFFESEDEAKHTALTMPNVRLGRVMRDGEADDKGRRKATDLFLWDLYVMWRTLEGLDIRADKYSAVRGRYHNGQEANEQRYQLTLDEARAMVGVG